MATGDIQNSSLYFKPRKRKASTLYSQKPTDGTGDFTVARNYASKYRDSNGLISEVAANIPVFEWEIDGTCPYLRLEPQRTNYLTYSNDFTNVSWTKSASGTATSPVVTSNYAISPDGTLNADRIVFDLGGGTTSGDLTQLSSASLTMADDYSNSVWLKSNTGDNYTMSFLKADGSITSITVTSTWQRFENSATVAATTTPLRLRLRGNESTSDYADISIWETQTELGNYVTSNISTSGGSATRLKDEVTGAGDSATFNSEEGVFFIESAALFDEGINRYFSLGDGTANNYIYFRYVSTSNQALFRMVVGGVTVCDLSKVLVDSAENHKFAFQWQNGEKSLWIDGVEEDVDSTATTFSANTLDDLSFTYPAGVDNMYAKIRQVIIFGSTKTDAELQTLTT